MPLQQLTLLGGLRAQRDLRKVRGKKPGEIQAAVNAAVRAGSSVELTTRTLKRMGVAQADIDKYVGAAYPPAA